MIDSKMDLDKYKWQEFHFEATDGRLIHMEQAILAYDMELGTIDFLTRWSNDGGSCPVHRHMCSTSCIVIEGEQRFQDFDPDAGVWLDEPRVRKVGEHGFSTGPDTKPHRETGGPEGCVAFFHMDGSGPNPVMYEFYDDQMNRVAEVTLEMIIADYEANT